MEFNLTLGQELTRLAGQWGEKAAFIDQFGQASFSQFNQKVNRTCHAMDEMGLVKGDRVAILSRNRTAYVEAYCLGKVGLVGMPLNWRLAPAELEVLLRDSGAKAIMADAHHAPLAEQLRDRSPDLTHMIALDHPRRGWASYQEMASHPDDSEPQVEVSLSDPLCLFYTSGTTGLPKGVVLTHQGLMNNAHQVAHNTLGLTPQDLAVAAMPLFHVGGMWFHLFSNFLTGCTTVIEEGFEPRRTLEVLKKFRATNIHLVPTMIGALVNLPGVEDENLDHLRLLYYAGSSIPEDILRRALAVFHNSAFLQSYGSTEGGVCTALMPQDHLEAMQKPGRDLLLQSCGRPLADTGLKIIGLDGNEAPIGEVGELAVKSPRVMHGYWRNPSAEAKAFVQGWFRMGDLARVDEDGYVYIVGRKHDMIVTGGENVFPHEVENALYANPKILEAAVFGLPDPKWVETVAAAVILKDGCQCDEAEIIAACKQRLASYKCPKVVIFTDNLPKNPAGKILKRVLRQTYGG